MIGVGTLAEAISAAFGPGSEPRARSDPHGADCVVGNLQDLELVGADSTTVPGSGIVSSCSSSKPLTVLGPPLGSCQPSERFSARMVALALTI